MATAIETGTGSITNRKTGAKAARKQSAVKGSVTKVMIATTPKAPKPLSVFTSPIVYERTTNEAGVLDALDLSPNDFDFNISGQYFKSAFARSLSLNNNTSKSMDFISANNQNRSSLLLPPTANRKCATGDTSGGNEGSGIKNTDRFSSGFQQVPPIPARRQTIETSMVIPTATHLFRNASNGGAGAGSNVANRVTAANGNGNMNGASYRLSLAGGGCSSNRRSGCWPPPTAAASSGDQECRLHDEADHETKINGATNFTENQFDIKDSSQNVEVLVLQSQVDTLQWQLKQAETSCGMYRAVMEEVARFFERFQKNSSLCRNEHISRSKSMHQVYGGNEKTPDSNPSSAYLLTRSSTNLIDLKRSTPSPFEGESLKNVSEDHYDLATPSDSYAAFKDFTWRRSPKKRGETKLSPSDEAEEKLVKEAFRLSRTIHNLLNTQQVDLTQHRQALSSRNKTITANANGMPDPVANQQKANISTEMLFLRTANMRDSRLSLRSSTDSSVHSTSSSSKLETDEDNYSPRLLSKQCSNICSTTEDESGFSSISSFQEIGVPLSSTMISQSVGSSHVDDTIDQSECNPDSRNSTLKATMHHHPSANNVGVPLTNDTNRWDPKTYRNSKFQRFSTLSNEDSATVLWV